MPRDLHQPFSGPSAASGSCPPVSSDAHKLLALLVDFPGSRISVEVAAAMFGTGVARAAGLLDELSRHGLMVRAEPERGLWGGHDIEPAFALRRPVNARGTAELSMADRHAALTRITRMFLREGVAVDRALDPFRARLGPLYEAPVQRRHTVAGPADWFGTWHGDLVAVQSAAFAAGLDSEAWQLAETLLTAGERCLTPPSPEAFDRASIAAGRCTEASPRCRMMIASGVHQRRAYVEAVDVGPDGLRSYAERLCAVAMQADEVTRAMGLREVGRCCLHRGSHHAAMGYLSRARDLFTARGAAHEAAITCWSIAQAVGSKGHHAQAIPELHRAAEIFTRCGDVGRAAVSKVLAAHVFYRLGRGSEALVQLEGCIPVLQDAFFPREEALAHALYARLHPHPEHSGLHAGRARELAVRLTLPPDDPLHGLLIPPG